MPSLPPNTPRTALIEADHVSKSFPSADGSTLLVLDDINFNLYEGEVVALLGKSGSGKSTILRCLAGLLAPTSGEVRYRGKRLEGANPGVAMVFQSFALMPWLTVQDNVELGLKAAGVPDAERRQRALAAIDQIGLDGFESAYPRELSGGMRQRVGFARALVLHPDVLMMDEPFSALDVLTSENLRNEIVQMWAQPDFPTKCICIVTHNVEESILLADRAIVLGSNPGHIIAEVPIDLPRPRDRKSAAFEAMVDRLYAILTGESDQPKAPGAKLSPLTNPLPDASVGGMAGLVEILYAKGGHDDLADLAESLSFEVDDLMPLIDAARMLGLLEVQGAQVSLTQIGKDWFTADTLTSKDIFACQAVEYAPLVKTITNALASSADGKLSEDFFRSLLSRGYNKDDIEKQLDLAIDWGRYGELFEFEANTRSLLLNPAQQAVSRNTPPQSPVIQQTVVAAPPN